MKLTCHIIKDLLPLYVENIASEDTRLLVEEHIAQCSDCKKELDLLMQPDQFPPDIETSSLRTIKRKINHRHWKAMILTSLIVLTVAIAVFSYLTAPEYIPYSQDLITVSESPDGSVVLEFDAVAGYPLSSYPSPDNPDHKEYHIALWKNKLCSNIEGTQSIILWQGNVDAVYYSIDDVESTLIYGTDQYPDGGVMILPRLVLSYYLSIAIALSIAGAILLFLLKKKETIRNIIEKITLLAASYAMGHICIKGFDATSYSVVRDLSLIVLIILPIYATLLLLMGLYKKGKSIALTK